ncbi:DciA family protein [Arcanobacterium hippocoleae]
MTADLKRQQNAKIAAAKAESAAKNGDQLPLQLLERARVMAEMRGWVRIRKQPRITREESTPLGDPVFVPLPGQEVGSGARPSRRDPKILGKMLDHTFTERGWGAQLEVAKLYGQWKQIVGEKVAENCQIEEFDAAGILTIRTRTVSWQTQLRALAAQLDARLAQVLGEGVIKEVRILGPHQRSWKHGRYSVPGRGPRDTYD